MSIVLKKEPHLPLSNNLESSKLGIERVIYLLLKVCERHAYPLIVYAKQKVAELPAG